MRALGAVVAALTIAGCGMAERKAVRDAPAAARRRQNCSPTISTGNAYLVYLRPLRARRTGPPAARRFWVVGGPQGNYIHTGTPPSDPSERSFEHQMSDVGTSLPQRISIVDARRR
jgi:hypothetical protein